MSWGRAALLACACCLSCSSAPFRGGYARPEGSILGSHSVLRFIPGHCEDAAHRELPPRFDALDLLETQTGRSFLVEHRQGYEMLVIENVHDEGSTRVFELVIDGAHLRRYRIPRSSGIGQLEAGRELGEIAHGQGFRAGLASIRASCSLVPKASVLPLGSARQ